jgi:hypothetical protein
MTRPRFAVLRLISKNRSASLADTSAREWAWTIFGLLPAQTTDPSPVHKARGAQPDLPDYLPVCQFLLLFASAHFIAFPFGWTEQEAQKTQYLQGIH